jgi:hypothetical protein
VPDRGRARSGWTAFLLVVVTALLLATTGSTPAAAAAGPPIVPLSLDRWIVSNLTGAEVAPGGGGTISFTVGNPYQNQSITSVVLTLAIYAFNAYPGNATSTVATSSPPVLATPTAAGASVNLSFGTLVSSRTVAGSVAVETSSTTSSGTYAVRTAVHFVAGGLPYVLESRGWFTASQWATATAGPGGSVTLNVSALGVSGVSPETSVLVSSSTLSTVLWVVLGASLFLIGAAAFLYFRPPKSRSGVRNDPGDIQAPSAFGSSRTKDGD